MADKKKPQQEGNNNPAADNNNIEPADIADKLTIAGQPLPIDPDTGDIIEAELTEEQRAVLDKIGGTLKEAAAEYIKLHKEMAPIIEEAAGVAKKFYETRAQSKLTPLIKSFNSVIGKLQAKETREKLRELRENLLPIQRLLNELDELEPFIKAELKKEEYGGLTFEQIMDYTPGELLDLLQDKDSLFYKATIAARAAKKKTERVTIKHTDNVEYPLDKISGKAWNLLTEDTGGQLKLTFDMLPKKTSLDAKAIYSINFEALGDNVKITKRLQPFDKRVYIAVSALFNAGNDIITATQVYYAMGNTGKPAAKHIKKIDDALSKMTGATITLDNAREASALKGKYPHFKYEGSLLPIEKITAIVNGQVTESAIHIFREPPLMTFAKERKQVTTIDVSLLQSPLNKTDANLLIDDYLIDRISKEKNRRNNKHCRILYETLYKNANITTTKQQPRAPEKIAKYLNHDRQQGFIKKFVMQADGLTIYFE